MSTQETLKKTTALLALAAAMAAAPYHLSFDTGGSVAGIDAAFALAKGGDDDSGGDDNGGGGDDRDDDSNSGSGSSGSGRGGDDDDDDDNSGRGSGSDDRTSGSDDRRSRGTDDANKAFLSDGSRIEIENGRLEIKNANGRTIVERPATAADFQMLNQARAGTAPAAAPSAGQTPPRSSNRGGGVVSKLEVNGQNIEVTYSDGWKEEIENGRYELKDERNRTVIERPARDSDRARLFAAVR